MVGFKGFPPGKERFTRIPGTFFTELLPQIDNLEEMKVTLYAIWKLERMEGTFRYLRHEDFTSDEKFAGSLGKNPVKAISNGLKKAVERGTLLDTHVDLDGNLENLFFLNTIKGQAAVKAILQGDWQPTGDNTYPIKLNLEKPNIFRIYEEHIGPLTPMIADTLKEAETIYPEGWIEEGIRKAVENNIRKWSYVEAILERWKKEGRDDRAYKKDPEEGWKKYVEGEFSDFIEH